MDSGVYIAVFYLESPSRIRVGKLGRFRFREGMYFYVGSAQRGLSARLERHARKRKSMRWHVDYLSVRATMLGAILIPGKRTRECRVAEQMSRKFTRPISGFGASDCRCEGHLFYANE